MNFTVTEAQETISERQAKPPDSRFLWTTHNELTLGPAAAQLAHLGATYSEGLS